MINGRGGEAEFLKSLFNKLNADGIYYAVMRNYQQLPNTAAGSDIDILIEESSITKFKLIFHYMLKESGVVSLGTTETLNFFKVFIQGGAAGEKWGVRFDVSAGYSYKGVNVLDMNKRHEFTGTHNGISVLSNDASSFIGVFKELMFNCKVPDRYRIVAIEELRDNRERIDRYFSPLSKEVIGLFDLAIRTNQSTSDLKKIRRKIKLALYKNSLASDFLKTILKRYKHSWFKIVRYVRPSGRVVCFLGTDGTGKSSVINGISPGLMDATHGDLVVRHLKPGFLPSLSLFNPRGLRESKSNTNPHGEKASGTIISVLRLSYLSLDYILGYWLDTRVRLAVSPTVVIYDRYMYDLLYDPLRFRIKLPTWVVRSFLIFLPRPDLTICLYAEVDTILARKQELPKDEVERQLARLKRISEDIPDAILISAEKSIDKVIEDVNVVLDGFYLLR